MPEIKEIAVTHEKPEKSQKERATLEKFNQLADHIIQAFTVPKRVPLYTQENSDHLISYEESELRLIIIGIFTSCILSLISLILSKGFTSSPFLHSNVVLLSAVKLSLAGMLF